MSLLAIESLQSGGAWAASIKGALPADLSLLSGTATALPAQIGAGISKLTNTLKVFEDLRAGDPTSVIGIVVAAIKAIVNSITKAAEKRERNYAEARLWYLGNARGVRVATKLKNFFGDGGQGGDWRYPRASAAKDRAVPYWDPLGTSGNMPDWLVPYGWASGSKQFSWPAVGNWLPDDCTNWPDISLGATCSGAHNWVGDEKVPVKHPTIVCWPWAYPLTCPSRVAGLWGKASQGPEAVVAGLYMLPTPQHIATYEGDVAASKDIILSALNRWFPQAYEAAPGDWRNTGVEYPTGPYSKDFETGTPDYRKAAPGVPFTLLATALSRIHGFEVCRQAIIEAPWLLPQDLRALLKGNTDFDGVPMTNGSGQQNGEKGSLPSDPSSGGGGIVLGVAAIGIVGASLLALARHKQRGVAGRSRRSR